MYSNSYIESLSSIFTQSLSALSEPDWQNIKENLSSFTHMVTSLEQTVECCLSSIPVHPYERLKYDYFDKDHVFKSLDDIEEPEKIPYERCIEYIKQKSNEVLSTTFHNLTCCEEDKIYTAFVCCSGDKMLPDHNRQKNYIGFLETTKNISLDDITDENYMSVAKKLISEYIKVI